MSDAYSEMEWVVFAAGCVKGASKGEERMYKALVAKGWGKMQNFCGSCGAALHERPCQPRRTAVKSLPIPKPSAVVQAMAKLAKAHVLVPPPKGLVPPPKGGKGDTGAVHFEKAAGKAGKGGKGGEGGVPEGGKGGEGGKAGKGGEGVYDVPEGGSTEDEEYYPSRGSAARKRRRGSTQSYDEGGSAAAQAKQRSTSRKGGRDTASSTHAPPD